MSDPEDDLSVHEAPTNAGQRTESASAKTAFPSAGRYQIESLLGMGGMGEVFKAFDPDLDRHVALKYLRGDDPTLLTRFQQEAKAQARLENEHVCKVYEVGEVDGRRYIAMQYIAGQTLTDAAPQMTVEQKVTVLRDAAEAVHAAHKLGLIHRDIKPANIMVERTEEGRWQAYVMDFGLVRDQTAQGMTVTGMIMGTPGFMAPEQLRGEVRTLDRRADVYGLGATLYALLGGRAPFGDEVTLEVMMKVLESDPESLSQLDAHIPADLETVVMKCLEKEPNRRYDSAKALADDLQRYLEGEPIQARRSTLAYRVMKKARKHRALVAISSVALILMLILGGISLRAQLAAQQREELAQRFGQQVKEIESIMRISHLVPLHDTRMEKELVRKKMDSIEKQNLGVAGKGPASYALGKGHLVLREYGAGRHHLEQAWNSGYRRPEVAYALGQVMGALYSIELQEAQRLSSDELIENRRKEIEKEYRAPALEYLKQSRGLDLEAIEYPEALIAFYELRYEEALRKARSVYERLPWLYEARVLEGDIYLALGDNQSEQGRYEPARDAYARAEDAYQAAMEIGHSDSKIYEGIGNLNLTRVEMEIYGEGRQVTGYFEKGLSACDMALKADPESADAFRLQAGLYYRMGEYERDHGQDPRPALAKSINAVEHSIKINPSVYGYWTLEEAFRIRATYELDRGINPGESVRRAYDAYQQAIRLNPADPDAHNSMGISFRALAGYEAHNGKDPRANLQKAIDAYGRAIESNPQYSYAYNNMGNAYAELAAYELDHGIDPRKSVEEVRRACGKAIEINPHFAYPYNNIATGANISARYEMQHGLDPRGSLQKAIESAQKGAQVKSDFAAVYGNIANAYRIRAEYEWMLGMDPQDSVERAIQSGEQSLAINPKYPAGLTAIASSYLVLARYEIEKNRNPQESLKLSLQATQTTLETNPTYIEAHLDKGLLVLLEARSRMSHKQNPAEAFARSRKILEGAIQIKADDARIQEALAELSLWQARWLLQNGKSAEAELKTGLEMAAKAQALNPSLSEAMAVQGLLLLTESQTQSGPQRSALVAQAKRALQDALAANHNLTRQYAGFPEY